MIDFLLTVVSVIFWTPRLLVWYPRYRRDIKKGLCTNKDGEIIALRPLNIINYILIGTYALNEQTFFDEEDYELPEDFDENEIWTMMYLLVISKNKT